MKRLILTAVAALTLAMPANPALAKGGGSSASGSGDRANVNSGGHVSSAPAAISNRQAEHNDQQPSTHPTAAFAGNPATSRADDRINTQPQLSSTSPAPSAPAAPSPSDSPAGTGSPVPAASSSPVSLLSGGIPAILGAPPGQIMQQVGYNPVSLVARMQGLEQADASEAGDQTDQLQAAIDAQAADIATATGSTTDTVESSITQVFADYQSGAITKQQLWDDLLRLTIVASSVDPSASPTPDASAVAQASTTPDASATTQTSPTPASTTDVTSTSTDAPSPSPSATIVDTTTQPSATSTPDPSSQTSS